MEPTTGPSAARLAENIVAELRAHANAENVAGMARYGIAPGRALGVQMPLVKQLARDARKQLGATPAARHALAEALWESGWREARLCAAFVDDPACVTRDQMERWAADFDSWDVCDGVCTHLFDRTPLAWEVATDWSSRPQEYVKRAGFVVVAGLAVHDKRADDAGFSAFLGAVERECVDERNFVKKAVNWALRHIGKRNAQLNREAITCARRILTEHGDSKAARWIARDALRELESEAVRARLGMGLG